MFVHMARKVNCDGTGTLMPEILETTDLLLHFEPHHIFDVHCELNLLVLLKAL
jgi:hypothetical protein